MIKRSLVVILGSVASILLSASSGVTQEAPLLSLSFETSLNAQGSTPKTFTAPGGIDVNRTLANSYGVFYGTGDYLTSQKFSSSELPAESTIAFWIKPIKKGEVGAGPVPAPTSYPRNQRVLSRGSALNVQLLDGFVSQGWSLWASQGYLSKVGKETSCSVGHTIIPDDGKWHHYVLTKGATGVQQAYLDGVLKQRASCVVSGATKLLDSILVSSKYDGFSGGLDEFNLYQRVLTSTEITALFTGQRGKFEPLAVASALDNPNNVNSLFTLNSQGAPLRALHTGFSREKTSEFYSYDTTGKLLTRIALYTGHTSTEQGAVSTRNALLSERSYAAGVLAQDRVILPVTTLFSQVDKEGIFGKKPLEIKLTYSSNTPTVALSGISLNANSAPTFQRAPDPLKPTLDRVSFRSNIYCPNGVSICPGPVGYLDLAPAPAFGTGTLYYVQKLVPSVSSTKRLC